MGRDRHTDRFFGLGAIFIIIDNHRWLLLQVATGSFGRSFRMLRDECVHTSSEVEKEENIICRIFCSIQIERNQSQISYWLMKQERTDNSFFFQLPKGGRLQSVEKLVVRWPK